MKRAGSDTAVIMKPADPSTGAKTDRCSYLFFPGCRLCAAEPEIVIKAYDSLLFQHPDTAIAIDSCSSGELYEAWADMGGPVIVTPCMECADTLRRSFPDMELMSMYELLEEMKVSGGCNSSEFILCDPADHPADESARTAVTELAESMGAVIREEGADDLPYITYCMDCRDSLKKQGYDAVHILELIYGLGDSNAHLEHEHDHDHDHDPSESEQKSDISTGETRRAPSAPLPDEEKRLANLRELREVLLMLFC